MTLAALHARFLQHCAVEKRLRPMTIKSYRSDFGLFLEFARRRARRRGTLAPQGSGSLRTFTTTLIRDYQAHMATRRWSINTVRRRLVELNRFAGWLVERRHLQRSPMIGISVPRRERRLPRVLDWSQVEQIMPEPHRRGGFVSHKMMGRAHLHPGGPPSRPEVIRLPALPPRPAPLGGFVSQTVRI